jgi:hypothetical protein
VKVVSSDSELAGVAINGRGPGGPAPLFKERNVAPVDVAAHRQSMDYWAFTCRFKQALSLAKSSKFLQSLSRALSLKARLLLA